MTESERLGISVGQHPPTNKQTNKVMTESERLGISVGQHPPTNKQTNKQSNDWIWKTGHLCRPAPTYKQTNKVMTESERLGISVCQHPPTNKQIPVNTESNKQLNKVLVMKRQTTYWGTSVSIFIHVLINTTYMDWLNLYGNLFQYISHHRKGFNKIADIHRCIYNVCSAIYRLKLQILWFNLCIKS